MFLHSDTTDELLTVTGLFNHFFSLDTTISERQFFKRLAQLIGTRAARLSACGIAAIISKQGYLEEGCSVATDGSLYNVRITSHTQADMIDAHSTRISEIPKIPGASGRRSSRYFRREGKVSQVLLSHWVSSY